MVQEQVSQQPPPSDDQLIDQFEACWIAGERPEISRFLPPISGQTTATRRGQLLKELVIVDLWFRWREVAQARRTADSPLPGGASSLPFLEDYIQRFPDLGSVDQLPPEMIAEEYRARLGWNERPDTDTYFRRFPGQMAELRRLFAEINADVEASTWHAEEGATISRNYNGLFEKDAASSPSSIPQKIGKYHVVGLLDEGGQAQVFRAVHPELSKEVVIKLCRRSAETNLSQAERLRAESRLLAELDHPGIARIFDCDFHEGRPFLVMEYIRGRNLRQHFEQHPPAPRDAALLVAKIARAVDFAHARGIVHLDIKPTNIIIDTDNEPRVIDFGMARFSHGWKEDVKAQRVISGTIEYMSPEQARGESDRVGPLSDVFALGGVLYYLLTGQAPYASCVGQELSVCLERVRQCDFDAAKLRVPSIPRHLAEICLRAMQSEPAKRYASAADLAADLEQFAARPARNRRLLFALAAICLTLAVLAGLLAVLWPFGRGSSYTQTAVAKRLFGHNLRHDFQADFGIVGLSKNDTAPISLAEGQKVAFRIEVDRDCYVGVWLVDDHGQVVQLFPNRYESDHFIAGGRGRTVPGGNTKYDIKATASEGVEYFYFVASTRRWEPQTGQQHGPYVIFASPEERRQWEDQIRGMELTDDNTQTVAETLIPFEVKSQ